MGNFIVAINIVLPIALTLLLGAILKKIKMVDDDSLAVMNKIVFRVFMGILMFINIYNIREKNINVLSNIKYFIYPSLAVLGIYVIAWIYYYRKIENRKKFAVMIQGAYRSNFVLFGLPIAESLYGQEGMSRVAMLLSIIVPIYNALAVVTLEYYSEKEIDWKKIIKITLKNPLIRGSILGIIFLKFGLELPKPIYKCAYDLSKIATPLSFIILGASLKLGNIVKHRKYLFSVNFIKLIISPALILTIAHFLKFSNVEMVAFLAMSGSPTAVSSFTMAKDMGIEGELAGEIVVSTTIFSIFTIFLWILILKKLGVL